MVFLDLIEKKKAGGSLTADEIAAAVAAYTNGDVPDYQMAALLMAIRWRGLSYDETVALTDAMVASGSRFEARDLSGPLVDKHSTGGVGDKVSLVLAPLAAACGCRVPMVSGRGLGHTGGTLDKLESIPGFRTDIGADTFRELLAEIGVVMAAQTDELVPADRLLYALRSATGTIDDSGLITASILSKKIAEGARGLVLDVKVGSGAFMPDVESGRGLARRLRAVAELAGLRCTALLTDMNQPLGTAVGNAVETAEAIRLLQGEAPGAGDLRALVLELTAEMLLLGELATSRDEALRDADHKLNSGAALERFRRMVELQGGDPAVADDPGILPAAARRRDLRPERPGWVVSLDARAVGEAAQALGAGRATKESPIAHAAGIVLHAKRGDRLEPGVPWASVHYDDGGDVERAVSRLADALEVGPEPPTPRPLVMERIG